MRQDKTYIVESPSGQNFYFIVGLTPTGIGIVILDDEPSEYTEAEQAVAVVQLDVETDSDATRVLARLWDDMTGKEGDASHIITLVKQEPTSNS